MWRRNKEKKARMGAQGRRHDWGGDLRRRRRAARSRPFQRSARAAATAAGQVARARLRRLGGPLLRWFCWVVLVGGEEVELKPARPRHARTQPLLFSLSHLSARASSRNQKSAVGLGCVGSTAAAAGCTWVGFCISSSKAVEVGFLVRSPAPPRSAAGPVFLLAALHLVLDKHQAQIFLPGLFEVVV